MFASDRFSSLSVIMTFLQESVRVLQVACSTTAYSAGEYEIAEVNLQPNTQTMGTQLFSPSSPNRYWEPFHVQNNATCARRSQLTQPIV